MPAQPPKDYLHPAESNQSSFARAKTANVRVLPVVVEGTALGEELEHYLRNDHGIDWRGAVATAEKAIKKLEVGA